MPKRLHHEETNEDRWRRKKYEDKLKMKRSSKRRIIYSDEEDEDHQENDSVVENIETNSEVVTVSSSAAEHEQTGAGEPPFPAVEEIGEVDSFDPRLLEALGEFEVDSVDFGDDIQTDLAARLQKILLSGINAEAKEEIIKKYLFPKILALAKAPTLDLEVGAMLAEPCKLRDKRLLGKQDQLGKALSALAIAMTSLMKKNSNISESRSSFASEKLA